MSIARFLPFLLFLAILSWHGPLTASEARLVLQSEHGDLSHGLVSFHLEERDYELDPESLEKMDQLNREFRPRALAIEQGGKVRFLNNDDVRHHVYSFSSAKRFELPLYKGIPPEDIQFEEAGEVVLGCNIHDWMVGWVHVMDTPYFAFADEDGKLKIELPEGEYEMRIWHPELKADDRRLSKTVLVNADGLDREIELDLEKDDEDDMNRRRRDRF